MRCPHDTLESATAGGDTLGLSDGEALGDLLGDVLADGLTLGDSLGDSEALGLTLGDSDGDTLGLLDGDSLPEICG